MERSIERKKIKHYQEIIQSYKSKKDKKGQKNDYHKDKNMNKSNSKGSISEDGFIKTNIFGDDKKKKVKSKKSIITNPSKLRKSKSIMSTQKSYSPTNKSKKYAGKTKSKMKPSHSEKTIDIE